VEGDDDDACWYPVQGLHTHQPTIKAKVVERGEAATLRYVLYYTIVTVLCDIQLLVWAYSFLYRPTVPGSIYLPLHPLHHLFYSSIPSKTLIIITPLRHRTGHIYTSNTTLQTLHFKHYTLINHHAWIHREAPPPTPPCLSQPANPSSPRLPSSPKPPTTKLLRTSISSHNHKQHPIKHSI
jgi:hypothetical protein